MKLNRKWVLVIALMLSVAAATAGTLAYLTDRDSEVNTFTVGNVEIDLNEKFEQDSELLPGVNITKEATITNTGKNDAWVWMTVLLPYEMGPHTAPDNMSASNNVVHWNYPKESAANIIVDFNADPVEIDTNEDGTVEKYYQTNLLWKEILEPGETTDIMMSNVYMDTHVDIDPDGNMYWVENGEAKDLNWNVNENGEPKIIVSAYAIQTEGFATVEEAYAAYAKQWGENGGAYEPGDSASVPFAKVTTLGPNDTLTNLDGDATVVEKNRTIDTTGSRMGLDVGKIPLDVAYQFEPTMTYEEGQASEYADWHADFVVTVNKDIPAYGIGLAGYYDAWCSLNNDKWVMLAADGVIEAGTEIRLVDVMGNGGITVSYEELCNYGNDGIGFLCGAVALDGHTYGSTTYDAKLEAGTVLTVELRLYEATGGSSDTETGNYITTGVYKYTFD